MMKFLLKIWVFVAAIGVVQGCSHQKDYTKLVNVFVGTDFHGHTFPGATLPHGMVQLSPDTRTETWDGCSGYHYSDSSILGFSHIHYSGVGSGGGADILLMPATGEIQINPGEPADTKTGYRAAFSHENEKAESGYYSVIMENGIKAELTATLRVGFHKYTFPGTETGNIILDLTHGINSKIDSLYLKVISDTKIAGFRHCYGGLDGNRTTWFVAEFSQPMTGFRVYKNDSLLINAPKAGGKNIKAHFSFDAKKNNEVLVKVALSRVDQEGAEKNLEKELPGWDFDLVREKARESWNRELSKIEIEGGANAQQRTFYTALYHTHIHPGINSDVDGRYRSTDRKVYTQNDFENYTTFSLWDTFRGAHPLYTLIDQQRTNQYIRSFLERYQHFGALPIMEFGGSEGFAMIGYHSLPVIADAWIKGIRGYDEKLAFEAMKKLSEGYRTGKTVYLQKGFIPFDAENQSVSKTLEYSYDDWCVSVLARQFSEADYQFYASKGQFYRNLFNPGVGFMQPKGSDWWVEPFDPVAVSGAYTEGNAFQYSLFVPHDINGLIKLMGGGDQFESWLDTCFSLKNTEEKAELQDVTGLIGQYAHGNEPSHHMAYLYNFVGKPWKTQEKVNQILTMLYTDQPDGLCGNEDAGQMSAWYVLSAMGFYPVTPGIPSYVIGSPLFDQVTIHLENKKDFIIRAERANQSDFYIRSAKLNGKSYTKSYLDHTSIMQGGELVVEMSDSPGAFWGTQPEDRPKTEEYLSAAIPQIESDDHIFEDLADVTLTCADPKVQIRYTTDGSEPSEHSMLYTAPFQLKETTTVKAKGFLSGVHESYAVAANFSKMTPQPPVSVVKPQAGIRFEYLEDYFLSIADMKKYQVVKTGTISTVNITAITDDRAFGYRFKGYILVPVTGVYSFYLNSNDGSNLYIGEQLLVDNDGSHGAQEKWGSVALVKGFHRIQVNYFQMGGKKELKLSWKKPNGNKEEIPAQAFYH